MALYLRPTAFIDSPVGFDGQFMRLAGGMSFFSAFEAITVEGGARVSKRLVPVGEIDAVVAGDGAAAATLSRLTSPRAPLVLGERTIRLDQPQVMGILNMTPDSFSDGGKHLGDAEAAASAGVAMAAAGAALVDVGGESTRPGAKDVWEGDEIARTVPVIERLARAGVAVSIDTRKAAVMSAALAAGAALVNDVSALGHDAQALALMAGATCPVVIMHWPDTKTHEGAYRDPLIETYDWLADRILALEAAGIVRSRLIVDPGIGFGKGVAENLALLNGLSLFHGLGCPLLVGASRKRFIGALAGEAPVEARLAGSLAVALKAAEQGAQIVRVHDVAETVQALRVWRGMRDQGLSG
ncbi:dihydropteroate synthase [Sphingomonas sp. SUN039]|uniref:dihydropteroate synthase n=1 Tax=Sphingomonas sp. SUN039 TaxID=2937787 RepID=UPI0021646A26|nr:dihydropteroate synthase [Sphingomonas sp. SUN039]UVO52887.1 dihydropteroate synthase [Sphingomonas sp. SUN039]